MKDFNFYENTLAFSIANEGNQDEVVVDLMVEGNLDRIAAGLALKMVAIPELLYILEYSLHIYDKLISETATS